MGEKWLREHPEERRAYAKRKYLEDPEYRRKAIERARIWRLANQEKSKATAKARYEANKEEIKLRQQCHKYGITVEMYKKMYQDQGGVCFICRDECQRGFNLSIDHNHATGAVRHLLCQICNYLVGIAENYGTNRFDGVKNYVN